MESGVNASADAAGRARPMATTSTKALYSFGSIAFGIKDNAFAQFLLVFYSQVLGVPAGDVGAALMIAMMVDAICDPIIGHVSDHWRSRLGRRHPFMYFAAIPVAITFYLLWNPPHWAGNALFYYLIAFAILVRASVSLYEIPSSALLPEFTRNYDERTSFAAYRYYFGWLGSIGMQALIWLVFFRYEGAQLQRAGYEHYGLVGAIFMLIAILVSAAGTHRHIPSFAPPPPPRKTSLRETFREMWATLSNRSLVMLLLASTCTAGASSISVALSVYFMTFFWEFTRAQIISFVIGSFLAASLASLFAPKIARRYGKRNTAFGMFAINTVVIVTPFLLRGADLFPRNGTALLFGTMFVFGLCEVLVRSMGMISTISMVADCVEDSQVRTGRRSEGLVFSAMPFIQKFSSGIGAFIAGQILVFAAFPVGIRVDEVDRETLFKLAFTFVSVIAFIKIVGLVFVWQYKITRESHAANLARLDTGDLQPLAAPVKKQS
jgi:Na+/melibiose symporter-like transporter